MATIKIKQGLDAARGGITPAEGELIYATDTQKVFIGDNSTLGGISLNQTATELLIALKTVDGSTSGLDIDTVDGLEGSQLIRNDQDGFLNGTLTIEDETLAAILQTPNANTITDVFLYDTSKDSDGGAWRERTSHTSWYNETLDTATRGSTKEFPAVALIVAETDKVMIYDATDSSYPMWMVFNAGVQYAIGNSTDISCCSMINGILAIGASTNNLWELQFIFDGVFYYNTNTFKRYRPEQYLSKRNTSISINISVDNHYGIINDNVNDVAMTVLDNAPIDTETGLPIPTIAVATDGGVSVIHNDGTVSSTPTITTVDNINFNSRNGLSATVQGVGLYVEWDDIYNLPDIGQNHLNTQWENYLWTTSTPALLGGSDAELIEDKFIGSSLGLNLINTSTLVATGVPSQTDGMVNYITKEYQSGWMQGDIKGAFLSSINSTSLVDTELNVNNSFTTDLTGWTLLPGTSGGTITQSAGNLLFTQGATSKWMHCYQALTTVIGEAYTVSINLLTNTDGLWFELNIGNSAPESNTNYNGDLVSNINLPIGFNEFTFVANSTTSYFSISDGQSALGTSTVSISSTIAADADRSVNSNSITVNGTVNRGVVETGAELMAYSGFSATNYLEQPYNSDLDFGTGDFHVMGWVKGVASGIVNHILDRSVLGVNNNRFVLIFTASGYPWLYTVGSGISSQFISSEFGDLSIRDGWFFICARRYSNGIMSITINSETSYSDPLQIRDVTNTSAVTRVGLNYDTLNPHQGEISLLRIGAGVPSDDQILEIYETEKYLFQENAACTLTSSTSSVNALAYDEQTDILSVAGSTNLDSFKGLVRVDSEVGAYTSLSSNNGIIAKGN